MAISKERLAKLIKTNSIIYYLKIDNEIIPIELKSDFYVLQGTLTDNKLSKYPRKYYELGNLYETKEEAEELVEFGNVTRTEKLELPTWEEVNKSSLYTLYFNNPELYLYRVYFNRDAKTISIEEQNEEYLECFTEIEKLKFTKENFNKARRLCVKLFRGESV